MFQIVVYVAFGSRLCENSIIPAWMANCALCKRSQGHLADYFRQSVSWSGEMFLHIYFERTPVRCWVSSFYGANTGIEACICGTKQAYSAPINSCCWQHPKIIALWGMTYGYKSIGLRKERKTLATALLSWIHEWPFPAELAVPWDTV